MKRSRLHPAAPALAALVLAAVAIIALYLLLSDGRETWTAPEIPDEPIVEKPIDPVPEEDTQARKARLINTLLPRIQYSNRNILEKRARVRENARLMEQGEKPPEAEVEWLIELGKRYRLDPPAEEEPDTDYLKGLMRRVDIIPADLALAQGAIESGWGTSRFSREGNNYFGQWCFRPGCGMVPASRPAGRTYEVESFPTVQEAVRRYMHNLNSHPLYRLLRLNREQARQSGEAIRGKELAPGLLGYAAIGEEYIRHIRQVIRQNDFEQYPHY